MPRIERNRKFLTYRDRIALNDQAEQVAPILQRAATANEFTTDDEVNDLTAAVTWDDVPDANVTQSSVTQHEAALENLPRYGLL